MKKVAAVLAVVCMCSSAFGGTVSFAPADLTIDRLAGDPEVFTLDVGIDTANAAAFNAADAIIGSDGLALTGFEWATFSRFFADISPPGSGVYNSQITIGYFGADRSAAAPLGVLTVDASAAPLGDYTIVVDATRDGGRSTIADSQTGGTENLFGIANVHIVPEPATISLLALGALALIRRRKLA